jgi:hypothetical protein
MIRRAVWFLHPNATNFTHTYILASPIYASISDILFNNNKWCCSIYCQIFIHVLLILCIHVKKWNYDKIECINTSLMKSWSYLQFVLERQCQARRPYTDQVLRIGSTSCWCCYQDAFWQLLLNSCPTTTIMLPPRRKSRTNCLVGILKCARKSWYGHDQHV